MNINNNEEITTTITQNNHNNEQTSEWTNKRTDFWMHQNLNLKLAAPKFLGQNLTLENVRRHFGTIFAFVSAASRKALHSITNRACAIQELLNTQKPFKKKIPELKLNAYLLCRYWAHGGTMASWLPWLCLFCSPWYR